ncbi:MAG: ATP-binding protein [Deferrisomatales bacterium]|nr:ATP-binding protein [Deferrisomatales bacterium]
MGDDPLAPVEPSAPDPGSRSRLQGYLVGRSTVLIALLLLGSVFQAQKGGFALPFAWFFAGTAAAFGFTLVSALALRRRQPGTLAPVLQPAWDVAYATVLVYLSGGVFSPFASLYPLAIIGAAILLSRRGALLVAAASSLAYGVLSDLQFYGLVTPLNPFPLPETEGTKLLVQLAFNIGAFFAVALLSGYLAEEVRRTGEKLEAAEAEVLNVEHLKDSILHCLGSGLVALDGAGCELFHNQAAEAQLRRAGLTLVPGMDCSELFALDRPGERREKSLRDGEVILGYSTSPLLDRDGTWRGDILIFQDLTEVKRLEHDLQRADRLAAVGRLAAGLAHEIRNPLASLSGSVEVLRESAEPDPESSALFQIVLRETQRLNRLVTNFLHYARPESADRQILSLHELVAETGFFFSQGVEASRFRLVNEVPPDLCLSADRGQLEQLLFNLFRNSVEAAPQGVTVTVAAREQPDGWTEVWVRDDGPGMSEETQRRAFEPFFSGRDGGTGLGLATVHRVVENLEGTISLRASPGEGAEFRVRIPGLADAGQSGRAGESDG